jgi:hypothetical protein
MSVGWSNKSEILEPADLSRILMRSREDAHIRLTSYGPGSGRVTQCDQSQASLWHARDRVTARRPLSMIVALFLTVSFESIS